MNFSAWIHHKFFFSPGIFTAQQKSTTLSRTFLFHFARFTLSVLYQFLPAMTKSVNYFFFFLQNRTGNYLLTQKEKRRSLSKEKQNTSNNIAGGMQGKRSPLVCAVAGGNTAVPASHPDCLPPALQWQGRKFNPLFTSAPWGMKPWDKAALHKSSQNYNLQMISTAWPAIRQFLGPLKHCSAPYPTSC